jgi:hypothetical protein
LERLRCGFPQRSARLTDNALASKNLKKFLCGRNETMSTAVKSKQLTWDPMWLGLREKVGSAVAGGGDVRDMKAYLKAAVAVAGPDRFVSASEGAVLAASLDTWSGDRTLHAVRVRLGKADPGYRPNRPLNLTGFETWDAVTLAIVSAMGLDHVPVAGHPRSGMI